MDLEEELGCTLIVRGKRHVTLTPEGLALKRRGEQILALADIAKTEITDVKKGLSGTLYLGHVDSNGPSLAAEWISSFKKEYPNVTYNLWCGTVDDLTYRMKSGLLELAITMTPLNTEQLDGITVYSDSWAAIIPGSHPLAKAKKQTVTLKDIVDTRKRTALHRKDRALFERIKARRPEHRNRDLPCFSRKEHLCRCKRRRKEDRSPCKRRLYPLMG